MNRLKSIIAAWAKLSLIIRIIICLIIGTALGLLCPQLSFLSILGSLFVGTLKAIAPLLVALLVFCSIVNASNGLGKRFRLVIVLYLATTILAAVVAVIGNTLFPLEITLAGEAEGAAPQGLTEVMRSMLLGIVDNPIHAVSSANYLSILFWAIFFGLILKRCASDATNDVVLDFSKMLSRSIGLVIQCAPFGILGLVFDAVSKNGMDIFADYGQLILMLVSCMLFVALVFNPLVVFLFLRINPYPLVLRCLRISGLSAFFTRSSAANIPINLELCRQFHIDANFYSVSIPLGSTINMSGAAVTVTTMTFCVCNTLGVHIDFGSALFLSIVATLAACGTSGVAGGSLLLVPLACSLFGIDNSVAMQAVGVGFIISVIQDSMETALNSSSDVVFTATAEYYLRKKKNEDIAELIKEHHD